MKRAVLVAVVASLWLAAGAASAAIVTISADASVYSVGDIITLTVNTDAQGEILFDAQAWVAYTGPVTSLTANQVAGAGGWITGTLSAGVSPGFRMVLAQIHGFGSNSGTTISSVLTFSADAPGTGTFTIGGNPNFPGSPFLFGTATPGASVSVTIVPEPATATLLGVGLMAFAAAARRRP